jgi:hypothetical protein
MIDRTMRCLRERRIHRGVGTPILITILIISFIQGCDKPSAPDFNLQQRVEAPLLFEKRFQVLGDGSGALIDTTSDNFDSLFVVNSANSLITLSKEQEVSLGDLNDVVPSVNVDPTEIATEVGVIEVDDFTSTFDSKVGTIQQDAENGTPTNAQVGNFKPNVNGSGSASNNDFGVTGLVASGGTATTQIPITLNGFTNATIVSGGLEIEFTNSLGFDLQKVTIQLKSDTDGTPRNSGSQIIFDNPANLTDGSTVVDTIAFSQGEILEVDLATDVTIEWNAQPTKTASGNVTVNVADADLVASSAQADIPAQALTPDTPDITLQSSDFSYAILSQDNEGGTKNSLVITVDNQTTLPLTNGQQTGLPTLQLRNSDGDIIGPAKPLTNTSGGSTTEIGAGETGQVTFDLSGEKLTKVLSYTLNLGTSGASNETVQNTDAIHITSSTDPLNVQEAKAAIDQQNNISIADTNAVKGDFVRAEVNEGSLDLTFNNQLAIPITISTLTLENKNAFKAKNTGRFFAAGSQIGSISNLQIDANSSKTATINLDGKGISDEIVINGTATSVGSTDPKTVSANDLISVDSDGSINVSQAESVLDPQDFTTSDVISISPDDFIFNTSGDYILLDGGTLRIEDIVNQLDVAIDTLNIEVNSLIKPDGNPLTIKFIGLNDGTAGSYRYRRIARKEQNSRNPIDIDLTGFKIASSSNDLSYNVTGHTRATGGLTDSVRTINSSDSVKAALRLQNLDIQEAMGTIATKEVLLNDDEPGNGTDIVDLYNDNEAEVDSLNDLEEISKRVDNIQLSNTAFNLFYDSNLGVGSTLYLAMVGIDANGNEVYLSPKSGGAYAMGANESISGLWANGQPIPKDKILKISLEKAASMGDVKDGAIVFNSSNSEVDAFLSNLPTQVRFVGKAVANPNQERGFVQTPIQFDTNLGFDIPINFTASTGPTAINDTTGANLDFFPDPQDGDMQVDEGILTIKYTSGLPFGVDLNLVFLDENEEELTTAPEQSGETYRLEPAKVDPSTHFVSEPIKDKLVIRLSKEQLNVLHQARDIVIQGSVETGSGGQQIKLRASDFIELSVKGKFTLTTSVN